MPSKSTLQEKNFFNIYDLQLLPIDQLIDILEQYISSSVHPQVLTERIVWPLLERCKTISWLGLGYLNLARAIETLSGWEIQRLRLAKQLGNKLTGITYVLDEPTIGLDAKEIMRVIDAINILKEMWNSIIVVEHNEEFIENSDWITEIGPWAWDFGGRIIFNGDYKDFIKSDCLTAQYIRWEKMVNIWFDHRPKDMNITIRKASKHNLDIDKIDIKLGSFTIVTGPSGAGKTTLLHHTLYNFLENKNKYIQWFIRMQMLKKWLNRSDILQSQIIRKTDFENIEEEALTAFYKELQVDSISGRENIQNVIYVDQTSIGKTPRSCPATFIGIFDNIRKIFAHTQESKMMGFTDSHFSFNSSKGACTECDWYGYKKIELQFLPDTYVPCTLCRGKRYKSEVLSIKRNGKSISDILNMYVQEAYEFFEDIGYINDELKLMVDIWLGYLKLWQPAQTLSGGESQRLKLVKHLLKQYRGHSIYFLDEPTVWLHPEDIQKLLIVLKQFLDRGDTILMIEHDQSLLKFADHVIRLEHGKVVSPY